MSKEASRERSVREPDQRRADLIELERLRRELASFGDVRLTLELVPATAWYSNLRRILPRDAWDRLRRAVYRRAGWRCEICGRRGPDHPIECHELWEYDDTACRQRLVGLIALCPACHAVKHLGRSRMMGQGEQAIAHLMTVNGWTEAEADDYVDTVFAIWELRSQVEWRLDVRWLVTRGFVPPEM